MGKASICLLLYWLRHSIFDLSGAIQLSKSQQAKKIQKDNNKYICGYLIAH